jgi:hypothetical protein
MKFQKLRLVFYIVFLIIVFYFGYGLGTLKSTTTKDVFVYDSPTKIRDFLEQLEKILIQDTGLTSDDPAIKRIIDGVKNTPPLAIVGPLIVFLIKRTVIIPYVNEIDLNRLSNCQLNRGK